LRGAIRVAVAGVLIVAVYHLSFNLGTSYTTAGTAALVVALAPALTVVLAAALGYERLTSRRIVGVTLAFAGVVVVIALGSGATITLASAKGPGIVLGATISFAVYSVLLKPLFPRYGAIALTAAASLVGTAVLLVFARPSTVESVAAASAGQLVLILFLGLASTLGAYLAWTKVLEAIGPARSAVYINAVPPLAVLIAALTVGETITPWFAAGGALLVLGVVLAQHAGCGLRLPRSGRARRAPPPRRATDARYAAASSSISGE
ncbi:MAG: DMT family transporter, partial [Actinomycetota bacterium]|nr:DMT family transporter [Actinomycetota bacterium]